MSFVYPYLFWMMVIPFIIFAFLVLTNKERVSRVFDAEVLKRLRVDGDTIPLKFRNITMFVAIFLMIVALSRPVIEKGDRTVSISGLTLMVGLDISGSMRSKDIYPNRLEFTKKKLTELLGYMPTDEIALTAFAHSSFMLAPFTSDNATLEQILDGVNESYINMASTDFSALGALASNMLEKKGQKILIVASDGGEKRALKEFAQILKESKITLYAILVGTQRGAPVIGDNGRVVKKKDGSIAITQLNQELGEIARETGGDFVVATNGKEDMRELASKIHMKFRDKKQGNIKIKERVELFIYPLGLATLLLLIGLSSLPRRRNR